MRKDKLYLLTFLSVTLIYLLVAFLAVQYLFRISSLEILENQLEFGKKEAQSFSTLVEFNSSENPNKEILRLKIQEALNGTDDDMNFLSILDWSGRIISHPDIKRVGQQAETGSSNVSSVADNLNAEEFRDIIFASNENLQSGASEVIFMYPVQHSDWIVVSHINTYALVQQLDRLRNRYSVIFGVIGLILIPAFVITVRFIGSKYENRLELQKRELESEILNLSKLNRAVGNYQQKVNDQPKIQEAKRRILTYKHNELVSVSTEEIAHIYTENTITYVVGFDGRKTTSNTSLDELFSQLDEHFFFRANRQFIIAISSIDKIVKYGNNQLKILVTPTPNADILISKNKAAEFKNWLNL